MEIVGNILMFIGLMVLLVGIYGLGMRRGAKMLADELLGNKEITFSIYKRIKDSYKFKRS